MKKKRKRWISCSSITSLPISMLFSQWEMEKRKSGGFSSSNTLIKEQKDKNPDILILDAGDFSMGTLIQVMLLRDMTLQITL